MEDFFNNDEWYNEDKILATYQNKNVDAFNKEIREKYWGQKEIVNPKTLLPGDKLRFKEAYSVRDVTLYHNSEIVTLETVEWKYHDQLQIEYWEAKDVNSPKQQIFRVVDPESRSVFNEKLTAIAEAKGIIDRAKILPQQELRLRRQAIIRMTHHSTEIEGNGLDIKQVEALYAKKKIDAPDRDIYEVKQLRLVICVSENDKAIGFIDLFDFDPKNQRVGIGIVIFTVLLAVATSDSGVSLSHGVLLDMGHVFLQEVIGPGCDRPPFRFKSEA